MLPVYWARFRKDPLDQWAVAMLVQGDAEKIYAALGKSQDRHDQVRYLLLRIREVSPDKFAAEHIHEHTAPGVLLALHDVFPRGSQCRGSQVYIGVHRVVGQTCLHVLQLWPTGEIQRPDGGVLHNFRQPEMGLPRIARIVFNRRWVGLVIDRNRKLYHWQVGSCQYTRETARYPGDWVGRLLPRAELDELLCPLPESNGEWGFVAPWWIKPYVPTAYRLRCAYRQADAG